MFRILVAEDDDSARFLMCEVLRRAGMIPVPPGMAWRRWR